MRMHPLQGKMGPCESWGGSDQGQLGVMNFSFSCSSASGRPRSPALIWGRGTMLPNLASSSVPALLPTRGSSRPVWTLEAPFLPSIFQTPSPKHRAASEQPTVLGKISEGRETKEKGGQPHHYMKSLLKELEARLGQHEDVAVLPAA